MPRRRPRRPTAAVPALALALAGLAASPVPAAAQAAFTPITTGDPVAIPGGHRAATWADPDGDGDLDILVTRGAVVGENNDYYRNDGGTFSHQPANAIGQDGLRADGASWGDFDGDGDDDLFVVSWYGELNALFENDGAGNFTRILTGDPVTVGTFSEDCAWVDYDADGHLDLFVASSGNAGEVNRLYRNDGAGGLIAVTTGALVTDVRRSRHGAWADWDEDGDLDVFVANEANQLNQLYRNELVETGVAAFTSVAAGDATTDIGQSFSASWGDFDNDTDLDLVVANFSQQNDAVYVNQLVETGIPTLTRLAGDPTATSAGWNVCSVWADFDNDADLDLFMTNGFSTTPGQTRRNFVFENVGGAFVRDNVTPPGADLGWSFGASFGDYDRDGDLDLFVANWLDENQTNYLYRNDAESNGNAWLTVRCVGTASNRSGIGARLRATATIGGNAVTQTRIVSGSDGYCSHNLEQHFGLADAGTVDLEIRWPSGTLQQLNAVAVNQHLVVVETSSVDAPAPVAGKRTLMLMAPRPNPFRDATRLSFELPEAVSAVTLDVYDAAGRRVRGLLSGAKAAGRHELTWDGRDAEGRPVAPGTYFTRLAAAGLERSAKVVRVE